MAKYIRELSLVAASLFVAALLPSCISEQPSNTNAGGVTFAAAIGKDVKVDTRAGITFNPVQGDYKDIPFYINAEVNTAGDKKNELAKYQVASGMLGRLAAMDGEDEILWYNKKDTHIFYAWTMPWQDDAEFLNKNPEAQSKISFLPSTYEDMESLSNEDRINCGVMERFVATKTQPLTYNINGELVEMYFQHLVSKIRINATRIMGEWPNNRDEVEAYMTFLDMPQEGIFYRHPDDGRAPYVEKSGDAKGVTCWIGGRTTTLYVCPEVDFSNMRFAIHLNDGHGNRSDYNGDFRSVIFKRPDEDLGHWDDDKKTTVLYAGEEMTINLVMRNDDAPNFTVNINPWTDRYRDGISHAKQGLYTKTEVEDLYNKFAGGNYTPEDVQEVFDLFGTEDENGDKIIYMYEDLEINHGHFPLDPAFILDGLGHVLQMRNTSRTFRSDGKKHEYCAQVPLCRNIFLTNGDGKHMIYIDDEYRIWKVNPDTLEMEDTGNKLPVPLPNGQKSYFIDYETGEVDTSSTV